jgi:hypothetical protein
MEKGKHMTNDKNSTETSADNNPDSKFEAKKKLIEELKGQWKLLWSERFDDRVRAEGVSVKDYAILDIEKGTIIHATKDFKVLTLKQILEKHLVDNPDRYVQPDAHVGGWSKFIKTEISGKSKKDRLLAPNIVEKNQSKKKQQTKKGGRGWLHAN